MSVSKSLTYSLTIIWALFSLNFAGHSQEVWTGVSLDYRLTEALGVELEEQFRFEDALRQYRSSFTELGITYRFWENFKLKGQYRYVHRPDDLRRERIDNNRQRVSGDLYFSKKIKKKDLNYYLRLRHQYSWEQNGDEEQITRLRMRFKYLLSKKAQPYFATELFYEFDEQELEGYRVDFGLFSRISSFLDLETFYRFEQNLGDSFFDKTHIIGLMLNFEVKP